MQFEIAVHGLFQFARRANLQCAQIVLSWGISPNEHTGLSGQARQWHKLQVSDAHYNVWHQYIIMYVTGTLCCATPAHYAVLQKHIMLCRVRISLFYGIAQSTHRCKFCLRKNWCKDCFLRLETHAVSFCETKTDAFRQINFYRRLSYYEKRKAFTASSFDSAVRRPIS